MRKILSLAFGLIIGLWMSPMALGADLSSFEQLLQEVPQGPIHLRHAKGVHWAEYCPDETCDVIRTKQSIDEKEFAGIALSYFFLVSDYIYLRSWKEDDGVREEVNHFLSAKETARCVGETGRNRSVCVLRLLADKYKLEVLFIRHDEGGRFIERIVRKDAIK